MTTTYEDRAVCGTCKWHERDENGDWVCCNGASENCADWTDYNYSCGDWEGRE